MHVHVQVRDELENLLDDDEDMAEMYLTEKLQQQLKSSSTSSMRERDDDMDVDDRHLNILIALCKLTFLPHVASCLKFILPFQNK